MKTIVTFIFLVCIPSLMSAQAARNYNGQLYSDVDVYLTNGTMVNGAVVQPIGIYDKSIMVKVGNKRKTNFDKNEISKLVFKVAGYELVFIKLKHNHAALYEKKDDEIFVQEFIKGKISIYHGYNIGYEIKRGKSTLVNDTNLWFCKKEDETVLSLIYADTNEDATEREYEANAMTYFKTHEIIGYIAKSNFEKLNEYMKQFNTD